jgi:hypothetical protein
MSERITAAQIARLRQLDAGRTWGIFTFESRDGYDNDGMECMHDIVSIDGNECLDILDTSDEGCVAFLVAIANAIRPALDEIERLRAIVGDLAKVPEHMIGQQPEASLTWFCKYCGGHKGFDGWHHQPSCVWMRARAAVTPLPATKGVTS